MYPFRAVSAFSGFTLVELIIVIAIVALMAGLAIPWFLKISQRNNLRGAAYEIQTTLLAARMRAVKRNVSTSVLIVTAAPSQDSHLLDTIEADPPPATPTPSPVNKLYIPKKRIDFVAVPDGGGKITFAGDGRMITPGSLPFPTPSLSNIVVRGVGGSAALNQITIQTSASGAVKVITPVDWQ